MCANNHHWFGQIKFEAHRAPWLHPGKVNPLHVLDRDSLAQQNCVAVPAKADIVVRDGQNVKPRLRFDQISWEGGMSGTKPLICFLQCHHVGLKPIDYLENSLRVTFSIEPLGLPDVVARKTERVWVAKNSHGA